MNNIKSLNSLNDQYKQCLFKLWNKEYPASLSHPDMDALDAYLNKLQGVRHYLIVADNTFLKAWMALFKREETTWFALIVDGRMQGKGLGKALIRQAKNDSSILNGWVIDSNSYVKSDGSYYQSPLPFYTKLGFHLSSERLENEKLSAVKIWWKK